MGVMSKRWDTDWAMTAKNVGRTWTRSVKGVQNWWKDYKGTMSGSHWRRAGEVNGKRGDNCGKVASKLMGRSMWTIGKLWEGHGVC